MIPKLGQSYWPWYLMMLKACCKNQATRLLSFLNFVLSSFSLSLSLFYLLSQPCQSQIKVTGLKKLFTTSAHSVHVKTAAGTSPCTSVVTAQRCFHLGREQKAAWPPKAAAASNPPTKWMDCFGDTGFKFH